MVRQTKNFLVAIFYIEKAQEFNVRVTYSSLKCKWMSYKKLKMESQGKMQRKLNVQVASLSSCWLIALLFSQTISIHRELEECKGAQVKYIEPSGGCVERKKQPTTAAQLSE